MRWWGQICPPPSTIGLSQKDSSCYKRDTEIACDATTDRDCSQCTKCCDDKYELKYMQIASDTDIDATNSFDPIL